MWKSLLLLVSFDFLASAVILKQDYGSVCYSEENINPDDVKDFKCYSLSGGGSENGLSCVFPLYQKAEASFICKGQNVKISSQSNRKDLVDGGITKEDGPQATIKFFGNCSNLAAAIAGKAFIPCYRPVETAATYPAAIDDCRKHGGSLYIPDNDSGLESLLRILPASIKSIWVGGGDLFYRNCERELAEFDDSVEVANVFTKQFNGKILGYTSTHQISEKYSYVCVNKCEMSTPPPKVGAPILKDPVLVSDVCSELRLTTVDNGMTPGYFRTACFPGGPLQYGEKLTFYAIEPAKFDPSHWWSFNLFTADKRVGIHFSATGSYHCITTLYRNGTWPNGWDKSIRGKFTPFPYRVNELFKQEVINTKEGLKFITNDKETFFFTHKLGNPLADYVHFAFNHGAELLDIKNMTVTQGGKDIPIIKGSAKRVWHY